MLSETTLPDKTCSREVRSFNRFCTRRSLPATAGQKPILITLIFRDLWPRAKANPNNPSNIIAQVDG